MKRVSSLSIAFAVGFSLYPLAANAAPPADARVVRVGSEQMLQLSVAPAEQYDFKLRKSAIGQIAFNEDASTVVLTPFSGRVTRLIARVGDQVRAGDPLFEIDSPEVVQAQTELIAAVQGLEKAKSQHALAKRVFDRQSLLLSEKATSQREVDEARNELAGAESDLAVAEGALKSARNRLRVIVGRDDNEVARIEKERTINGLITVNAPIAGTVINRKVGPGQYVRSDSGEQLYAISDMSTMWLKAHVPESDIPYVKVGQELEVKVLALPDRVFNARIIAIGSSSDVGTRRVVVRSEIPNPDGMLKAEMFANFRIVVSAEAAYPCVPTAAVIREGEKALVWVQSGPQAFERRNVTIGSEQDGRVQIRDGLKPGEIVVVRGAIFVDNEGKQ